MSYGNLGFLRREEQLKIRLKALYKSYGYKEYKLSGIDEYSLYADNRSFLGGRDVISFSAGGKLLALRPDVTLSIIKKGRFGGQTEKLFYDEKVYRKTARGGLSEVSQIGVEVIGDIDIASEAELCTLMLKTLSEAGEFVLDISHTGITSKILKSLDLNARQSAFVLSLLESKNVHDFTRFARENGLDGQRAKAFEKLITLPDNAQSAKKELEEINKVINIQSELDELTSLFGCFESGAVNLDFSIGGDSEYYNGLIFKGYVKGIPHAVLSGGRYDRLLSKTDEAKNALGFALYLGELCKYSEELPSQPDAALVYKEENSLKALKTAEELRAQGINLLLCRKAPEGFKGKIYSAENLGELK